MQSGPQKDNICQEGTGHHGRKIPAGSDVACGEIAHGLHQGEFEDLSAIRAVVGRQILLQAGECAETSFQLQR